MSRRPILLDAFNPAISRLLQVAREQEILRVTALIGGQDPSASSNVARHEVLKWAQNRAGGHLPNGAWAYQNFEWLAGGRNSSGVRIENATSDIWAIRAEDPDTAVPGRTWVTEVVIGSMRGQPPRFSARLLVSTSESVLSIEPHAPGFVQQVAEECSLTCGLAVGATPWLIESVDESESLTDMLVDEDRKLPVFVLTVPEDAPDPTVPLLNAQALARATVGIGHVVILPAQYTWALTNRFGRVRSVFGGAARTYLSGFSEDANPYAHRLVLSDQLSTDDGVGQCVRWMRWLAATESIRRTVLGKDVLAFAAIKNASLELAQQRLEREGASESEQLATAKARIDALEKRFAEQERDLEYFDSEHKSAIDRAEAAEEQARASAFRIQQLLHQRASSDASDGEIELPTSWVEFANWCDVNLGGQVVLSPQARRGLRSPNFEDVQLAARCLKWLATTCRDQRIEGGANSLRDVPIEPGIRNAHCGEDQFDLDWQGQRHTADWHIKNGGNTRDPTRCLRIYYFWDSITQQIVVAEMPAHRRTGAT